MKADVIPLLQIEVIFPMQMENHKKMTLDLECLSVELSQTTSSHFDPKLSCDPGLACIYTPSLHLCKMLGVMLGLQTNGNNFKETETNLMARTLHVLDAKHGHKSAHSCSQSSAIFLWSDGGCESNSKLPRSISVRDNTI
jgi:hypothetical protein